jgi:hypothetical protein
VALFKVPERERVTELPGQMALPEELKVGTVGLTQLIPEPVILNVKGLPLHILLETLIKAFLEPAAVGEN